MTPPNDNLDRFAGLSRDELLGEAQRLHHQLLTSKQSSATWQNVAERKGGNGVKTTWLVGVLTMLVMAGGAAYVKAVDTRVASNQVDLAKERDRARDVERKVDVLGEKVQRVTEDTKEIKGEVKEQGKKLDEIRELLRRR